MEVVDQLANSLLNESDVPTRCGSYDLGVGGIDQCIHGR